MWLLRMLGWKRPERPRELDVTQRRSDAVLQRAEAAIRESDDIEKLRGSFRRAGRRLA